MLLHFKGLRNAVCADSPPPHLYWYIAVLAAHRVVCAYALWEIWELCSERGPPKPLDFLFRHSRSGTSPACGSRNVCRRFRFLLVFHLLTLPEVGVQISMNSLLVANIYLMHKIEPK